MLMMVSIISTPMANAVTDVNYFGELITIVGHPRDLAFVDWSPDGTKIVSSDWGSGIKIWNATDGSILNNLTGHSDAVWTVKWSPDGTKIASASWDRTVRVWDSSTGETLAVYNHTYNENPYDAYVWGLEWSPDGTKILSGTTDGRLIIWDVSTGNPVMTLKNHTDNVVTIEWSPDGTMIATGAWEDKIIIRNASTYDIVDTYDIYQLYGYEVESISWSPDSSSIAAGGDRNNNFTIIDVLNGNHRVAMDLYGHIGRQGIYEVSWSPDGTKIATAMTNSNIFIWDVKGSLIRTLTGHNAWVETVSWSPDSTKLASGACDDTVRIWGDLGEVISTQKETIQKQQASLDFISANLTRFEQNMQSTFENPTFLINGTTPEDKITTLVDALINLSHRSKNELYKLLG